MILLVFFLLLLISKTGNIEKSDKTLETSTNRDNCIGRLTNASEINELSSNFKWAGLGINIFSMHDEEMMDNQLNGIMDYGFKNLRMDIPDYQNKDWLENSKKGVINAISRDIKVTWGVSSNKLNDPSYEITSSNWPHFRAAIIDAAWWAQANGVFEFQLGNEEEFHIDEKTITVDEIVSNLKSVATEVQGIFTNGKISYSCGTFSQDKWISMGKGDIDLLALNVYQGSTSFNNRWKSSINIMKEEFGTEGTYLSEFGLSSVSVNHYSKDEKVQLQALNEMIEFIRNSGIERAFYFCWDSQ